MFKILDQITKVDVIEGRNQPRFIIVHDTASQPKTTFQNLLRFFKREDEISVHYTIDYDGTIVQLADEKDVCFHAGVSRWSVYDNLNYLSVGIEVFHNGKEFTEAQRLATQWLCKQIMERNQIKSIDVLRHADVAFPRGRKSDIRESFFQKYGSWQVFQSLLIDPKKAKLIEDNEKILAQRMKTAWAAVDDASAVRKYLAQLKGVPFKPYIITE